MGMDNVTDWTVIESLDGARRDTMHMNKRDDEKSQPLLLVYEGLNLEDLMKTHICRPYSHWHESEHRDIAYSRPDRDRDMAG